MKKRFVLVVPWCLGAAVAAVVMASGCRPKPVVPAAAPQSAEAIRTQARDAQTARYILNRRATARKNNIGHSIH